jgi:hypothetical protein
MKDLAIHANLEGGMVRLMGADNTDVTGKAQDRLSISLNAKPETKTKCAKSTISWLPAERHLIHLKGNFG